MLLTDEMRAYFRLWSEGVTLYDFTLGFMREFSVTSEEAGALFAAWIVETLPEKA